MLLNINIFWRVAKKSTVDWFHLVWMFYFTTLFGSFNIEGSPFLGHLTSKEVILIRIQIIQFSISTDVLHTVKFQNSSISNNSV